jgi:NAD(P)H-hydrate epimerase
MSLPVKVWSVAPIRALEAAAIAAGVPGYALMQRAGTAALQTLRVRWPEARKVAVVCGTGNNGGDGLVLARLARQAGLAVDVHLIGDTTALHSEAREAFDALRAAGLEAHAFVPALLRDADVVVDALLGIGVRAPLRPDWRAAIDAMNDCGRPVFAIDIPSGLEPDTGESLPAVRATATLAFIGIKAGMVMGEGPAHCGEVEFDALGIAPPPEMQPLLERITAESITAALTKRARHSHKSMFGRVLVVGGGVGMPGAVRLAAEAALRVGAGLVHVASLPEHLVTIVGARPELMFYAIRAPEDLAAMVQAADVIAIGPGLGRGVWAEEVLTAVFAATTPEQKLVVDADALNIIGSGIGPQHADHWILTPHPGEAARLLGRTTQSIQGARLQALHDLYATRGGVVVLKGAGTLVGCAGAVPRLCEFGNPGMAVPGMGDVLTGAIAGILAQGAAPFDAACAGVLIHALAGDRCARGGTRGILAGEVCGELRNVLAPWP